MEGLGGPIEEQRAARKKCPFCAEEILAEAVKCKHCGEMLQQANVSDLGISQLKKVTAATPWSSTTEGPHPLGLGCGCFGLLLVFFGVLSLSGGAKMETMWLTLLVGLLGMAGFGQKLKTTSSGYNGVCPYCETSITVTGGEVGVDCPTCKHRIVVRENKFHQV